MLNYSSKNDTINYKLGRRPGKMSVGSRGILRQFLTKWGLYELGSGINYGFHMVRMREQLIDKFNSDIFHTLSAVLFVERLSACGDPSVEFPWSSNK
jgi:hypothetical protein